MFTQTLAFQKRIMATSPKADFYATTTKKSANWPRVLKLSKALFPTSWQSHLLILVTILELLCLFPCTP